MSIVDQVKTHRKEVKYEQITFSLWELVGMYQTEPKEISIRPDFQRLFRWSREQQSNFIESLMLEIPIPPLFFFEKEEDGTWDLLDGLQRVSTLIRFIGAEGDVVSAAEGLPGNDHEWHYENEHNLDAPLQLLGGQYLTELAGMRFKTLPMQLQLNLKRARIHVFVLKRETHRQYKYEVFKRINTGGSQLLPQELRNCSIRLINSDFPDFLESIVAIDDFARSLGLKDEYTRNGYLQELALRFFAMKNKPDLFRHDVGTFLTTYMEEVAKRSYPFNFDSEKELFCKVFSAINRSLTEGSAFRGKNSQTNRSTGPFSPAIYEAMSVGIAVNIDKVEAMASETLKDKLIQFIKDLKDQGLTGAGSNSKSKTIGRLQAGKDFFRN